MGLSFAIPIDVATGVRDQLIKTGKVSRGRIGVQIQEVSAQLADSFGLDRPRGALVGAVENDGPGAKAGIKAGDVIVKVDGRNIDRVAELPLLIGNIKPGSQTQLELWRDREIKRVTVTVTEVPAEGAKVAARGGEGPSDTDRLGLAVRLLKPDEKSQADTDGSLVVEDVSGPAAQAGVQPGDIILAVGGTRVKTVAELQAAAKKSGKTVALLIERENAQIFVPVRTG
jgi:serine protease Do